MADKFTLTGTDNNGFRHRYSALKNEDFKKAFVGFMLGLGFDKEGIQSSWVVNSEEEDYREIKIKEFEDECRNYLNDDYDVDVFYGKLKIIIVVRTKKRIQMVKHLEQKSKWIKPPIVKKIKNKKRAIPEIVIERRKE